MELELVAQSPDDPAPAEEPARPPALRKVVDEADNGDPAESVRSLAGLSAARLSLEDLLARDATFAVHAIPGTDGAGQVGG
jgi:hypothetical protein